MFLYDKKDKSVDVFTLTYNAEEMRNYKMEQMKKIPANKRGLFTKEIITSLPYFRDPFIPILLKKDLYSEEISISELIGTNKSLNYNIDHNDVVDLLEWFYSEKYSDRPVARVLDLKNLRYLLVASSYVTYQEENDKVIAKIEDIIEIPKSLYLLQLLQQQKFSSISDEDISEQLDLFKFSYIDNVSIDELKKMDACGITKDSYSKIINKANNDKQLLKLLKK